MDQVNQINQVAQKSPAAGKKPEEKVFDPALFGVSASAELGPVLHSVNARAAAGSSVTANGANFSEVAGNNLVQFLRGGNVVRGVFPASATHSKLMFVIPPDLADGAYEIRVENLGAYLTFSNTLVLTVLPSSPAVEISGNFGGSMADLAAGRIVPGVPPARDIPKSVWKPSLPKVQKTSSQESYVSSLEDHIKELQARVAALNSALSAKSQPTDGYEAQIKNLQAEVARLSGLLSGRGVKSAPSAARMYTVKQGDTLWSVSKKFYGDGRLWRKILESNTKQIKNPKNVKIGTVLTLPDFHK